MMPDGADQLLPDLGGGRRLEEFHRGPNACQRRTQFVGDAVDETALGLLQIPQPFCLLAFAFGLLVLAPQSLQQQAGHHTEQLQRERLDGQGRERFRRAQAGGVDGANRREDQGDQDHDQHCGCQVQIQGRTNDDADE